jgi:hypothetical protein
MDIKNIEEVLSSISNDILTEDAKASIAKMFNEAVDAKVKSQAQLLVEAELAKMDDDHSEKLKKLIESIDTDHTNKFKQVIQKIDEAHTAKLKKVIAKYETELKEGAEKLHSDIVSKISNYLDLYLTETIPATHLKEAVENVRARKMLDEIKKIVAVDPEFISENFKEALKDGHDTIEKLRGELNSKIKESVEINQQLINTKATLLLEQKTKDLPKNKKDYVMKLMESKKPEEIESNFKFVVEMYEKDEADKVADIAEKAKDQKITATQASGTDTPKSVIIENVQKTEGDNSAVNSYLDELKKI